MGNLDQQPGAIARSGIGSNPTAMGQIDQASERLLHNIAGRPPLDIHDKTHAAGVVLVGG